MEFNLGTKEFNLRNLPTFLYPKYSIPVAGFLLGMAAFFFFTRGSESHHIQYGGGFTSTKSGMSLGGNSVFALEGQTIRVNYDVTAIPHGKLRIRLLRSRFLDLPDVLERRTIGSPGPGEFEIQAPGTGFYKIECDGSPDGNGYDVTYTTSWKVS